MDEKKRSSSSSSSSEASACEFLALLGAYCVINSEVTPFVALTEPNIYLSTMSCRLNSIVYYKNQRKPDTTKYICRPASVHSVIDCITDAGVMVNGRVFLNVRGGELVNFAWHKHRKLAETPRLAPSVPN